MSINHDYTVEKNTDLHVERTRKLRQLRQVFDRHAAQCQDVAFLPREIARRMHERLRYIKPQPAYVLDAGCGAGEDINILRTLYSKATIYGVDLSHAMLHARHSLGRCSLSSWRRFLPAVLHNLALGRIQQRNCIQADFSSLPFKSEYFNLLWSNLALQWHECPDLVFLEWQRVLKTGGMLIFSTLGPDTLRELRSARAAADSGNSPTNVHKFIDMHDYGDMLAASGFEIPVIDMDILTITYSSPHMLLADVRLWGTIPQQHIRRGHVLHSSISRSIYHRLIDALEVQRRPDGMIPLTFEVLYGYARKAVGHITPEGYNIIRVDDIGHKLHDIPIKPS
ncbi:methyltransferase domain-containing protein [Candidatus Vallotia tarda]|uniref:Malonyl-[acyl-carrier protein] O-methyltransferase n=1 Tax=Candidatus Vallotiella hemipterorum TaxID=1177213 RepID=A0A916JR93_9BURK|nr:methyltransferase domain-containing protein [Candidatus Vallotia tarda]CAG7596386.1 Malonyl-[acyl-carrier protein] O-methyltransferase [Candidatus Vallotia tarda]